MPGAELGIRLADLQAHRPALGMKGDGIYREELRELDVEYGFWPKEATRPPPLSARLMSIKGREQVYDTVGLWSKWWAAVERTGTVLGVGPRCALLTGARVTMIRADYAGKAQVSVLREIWRAEDRQDFDAFLVTRVRLSDYSALEEAGMENQGVDCWERYQSLAGTDVLAAIGLVELAVCDGINPGGPMFTRGVSRAGILLGIALVAPACGERAATPGHMEAWDTAWVYRPATMDTTLLAPAWVVAFRDGVVVGDGNSPRVTAFDSQGRARWVYAPTTGDGPGEMRIAVDAIETGEGLWLLAWPNRLVLVSDQGEFVRQMRITPDPTRIVSQIEESGGGEAVLLIGTNLARVSLTNGHLVGDPVPIAWARTPPGDWIPDVRIAAKGSRIAAGMTFGPEVLLLEGDSFSGSIFREEITYRVRGQRVEIPGGGTVMTSPPGVVPFGASRLKIVGEELWILTGGAYLNDRAGLEKPRLNNQLLTYQLDGTPVGARTLPLDTRDLAVTDTWVYLMGVTNEEDPLPSIVAMRRR